MRQKTVITKLLQSVTEVYYKVRQVLQRASGITKGDRLLLQSVSGITKSDSYYKVRRNTCQWLRLYLSWAKLRNKEQEIERLEPNRLNKILQQFYAEVKRKDGTDYEPSPLQNMQAALLLKGSRFTYSLQTSRYFLNSRNVLERKARLLREQGKGKRSKKAVA